MWKPQSQEQIITCDLCGGVLPLEISSDKKCRCERCGKIHLLSDQVQDDKRAGPTPPVVSARAHVADKNIIFYCLACQSRLVARYSTVGQKTRCPTCGVGNTVPKWLKSPPPEDQFALTPQDKEQPNKEQLPPVLEIDTTSQPVGVNNQPYRADREELLMDWPLPWSVEDGLLASTYDTLENKGAQENIRVSKRKSGLESKKVLECVGTSESEPPKSRSRELNPSRPSKRPELPAAPLLHGVALMLCSNPIPALWLAYSTGLALVATLLTQAIGQASQGAYAILAILLISVSCVLGTLWWMAGSLIYFRLLGRFGWWLAESLPLPADEDEPD